MKTMKGGRGTYHDDRITRAGEHIELALEHEREVVEDPAREVDEHERDGQADDLFVLPDLVVLREQARANEHGGGDAEHGDGRVVPAGVYRLEGLLRLELFVRVRGAYPDYDHQAGLKPADDGEESDIHEHANIQRPFLSIILALFLSSACDTHTSTHNDAPAPTTRDTTRRTAAAARSAGY